MSAIDGLIMVELYMRFMVDAQMSHFTRNTTTTMGVTGPYSKTLARCSNGMTHGTIAAD